MSNTVVTLWVLIDKDSILNPTFVIEYPRDIEKDEQTLLYDFSTPEEVSSYINQNQLFVGKVSVEPLMRSIL